MNYDQLIDSMANRAWDNYPIGSKSMTHNNWEDWLRQVMPEELLLEWADIHCARLVKEAFPEWES